MVFLRATRKVLSLLPPTSENATEGNDTALGDWFVNRIVIDRRPLLLLISSTSLLPILIPARDVRHLPEHLPDLVEQRLERLGVDATLIRAEVSALTPVGVGPTNNRSVVGILTDFCRLAPYYFTIRGWGDAEIEDTERKLSGTPCFAGRRDEETVFPDKKSVELLWRHWSSGKRGSAGTA